VTANFHALIESRRPADPDALLLETDGGERWSHRDVAELAARMARALERAGAVRGDRVAVQVEKSPEALALYLACLRAGFVYVPLNTAYRPAEVAYFLSDAQPAVFVCHPASLDALEVAVRSARVPSVLTLDAGGGTLMAAAGDCDAHFPTVDTRAGDLAALVYTSGTTGRSKGAMITHGNLAANGEALVAAWGFAPADVLLHALPLFHIHGLFVASHCVLLTGARMLFHGRFDARRVLRDLPRASVLMGVPTFYTRLLDEADFGRAAAANVRLFVSGSAPLLTDTFTTFEARTGKRILERYGMSEAGIITSNPLDGERRAGTVGRPLHGVEVRVADGDDRPLAPGAIGGVQIRGPSVFTGYWNRPDKTREEFTADGWFRTGDVGRFDGDGYLSIVGRAKDLIITGGYNVYPKEVELVLDALPGVLESAVVGLPHPDFGEAVTAVVVAAGGARLEEAALIAALKTQLAGYKVPKRVHVVDDLPRNAMGKVQKAELRRRYGA
jgi:malonyl-CoA/methylmalonyl-CoA synthetase